MNAYAGTVLGCFTNLEILTSLIMVQLEPKHVGECMIENSKYRHLPNKYIFFFFFLINI
jgi:hypothetical protein